MSPKRSPAKSVSKPNTSSSARPGTTQVQLRMPDDLLQALTAYVDDLNAARSYPKLTRTDVMLGVLDWVIRTRPDWEIRGTASAKGSK